MSELALEVPESGGVEVSQVIGESLVSVPDAGVLSTVGVPTWCDPRHVAAAWVLSEGSTQAEAASRAGVTRETIIDWLKRPGYAEFVRRLVPYTGLATRSGQLFEVKRLYRWLTGQPIDKALKKSDGVHLVRLAGELGAAEAAPLVPQVRAAQAIFIGTQISVQQGTVMSPPGATESSASGGLAGADVVEGESRDLGPEQAGALAVGGMVEGEIVQDRAQ